MKRERHLTWHNFRDTFIEPSAPALHPIPGTPHVHLFVDAEAARIGVRLPCKKQAQLPASPLKVIKISHRTVDKRRVIELSTTSTPLFPQFYHFAVDLADRVQISEEESETAIAAALKDWNALLKSAVLLSLEQRLGLMGELWLLRRLIIVEGKGSVESWVGPKREPHDFRLKNLELEVKTTTSVHRDHMINGIGQLTPSEGMSLYLVSIQLAPTGSSRAYSLSDRVSELRTLLKRSPPDLISFNARLERYGFNDDDATYYSDRFILRSKPALIEVGPNFPRITQSSLVKSLGSDIAARIDELHYRINVDKMGYEDGSKEFESIIPPERGSKL